MRRSGYFFLVVLFVFALKQNELDLMNMFYEIIAGSHRTNYFDKENPTTTRIKIFTIQITTVSNGHIKHAHTNSRVVNLCE